MIVSFILCLSVIGLIGMSSIYKSTSNKHDYYLASGEVKPWLVGLSAVATNNSGYMFIGVIGYTYYTGFAAIWLMVGWLVGDFISSLFVHQKLKQQSELSKSASYAGALANWSGTDRKYVQQLIALISLLFLLTYAAAQLLAGSKALFVLFNWPLWLGAVIGVVIVCAYCWAGGIRASIWTDAAQSIVMFIAMAALLWFGLRGVGGVDSAITAMSNINGFTNWQPADTVFPHFWGILLFVFGWAVAGFSVIGQPHIMIRFMTINASGNMWQAKLWYYLWFASFYCMATGVGLLARLYLPDSGSFDAELALPMMAIELLPEFAVGIVLAGIFSATMSTADSLILSCSAAISSDLAPQYLKTAKRAKVVTLVVCLFTFLIAISGVDNVFDMVIFAWSGMASAFAPLLIIQCFHYRPNQYHSMIAILLGLFTAIGWRLLGWHQMIYEGVAGIIIGLLWLFFSTRFSTRKNNHD